MEWESLEPEVRGPAAFLRGVGESVLTILGFVAFGLIWAAVLAPGGPGSGDTGSVYTRVMETRSAEPIAPAGPVWLVDGYNVLQVGLLAGRSREAWWRAPSREQLMERLARLDEPGAEVFVVFDGPRPHTWSAISDESGAPRLHGLFHPSADDWLLEQVRSAADPSQLRLVTADRQLADRARHRGAQVVSPRTLLSRCGV